MMFVCSALFPDLEKEFRNLRLNVTRVSILTFHILEIIIESHYHPIFSIMK
jgi:hypothetical protein